MSDLLTPRVIVTGYYPGCPFQVNEILWFNTLSVGGVYVSNKGFYVLATEVQKASLNFRPIAWWAYRAVKDMPKHIKSKNGAVLEVLEWSPCGSMDWNMKVKGAGKKMKVMFTTPATERDYHTFINKQNENRITDSN